MAIKKNQVYEMTIYYDKDDMLIETNEYDDIKEVFEDTKSVLYGSDIEFVKIEIALVTKDEDGDNIECELLYTITPKGE